MTTKQNTEHPSPSDALVSAGAVPHRHAAPAHVHRKVTASAPNFDEAPAGLRPIGGVLAGIIAGLKPE